MKIKTYQSFPKIYNWYTIALHWDWYPPLVPEAVHLVGYSLDVELPIGVHMWTVQPDEDNARSLAQLWAALPNVYNDTCLDCRNFGYGRAVWNPNLIRGENRPYVVPEPGRPTDRWPTTHYVGRIIYWPDWPPL